MASTMKAAVVRRPGPAEVLQVEEVPVPEPEPGQVLIRVNAFGINRSELITRSQMLRNSRRKDLWTNTAVTGPSS
jgi:NADPH:quinone reductase-like Zn-dependent oxidoreductase